MSWDHHATCQGEDPELFLPIAPELQRSPAHERQARLRPMPGTKRMSAVGQGLIVATSSARVPVRR